MWQRKLTHFWDIRDVLLWSVFSSHLRKPCGSTVCWELGFPSDRSSQLKTQEIASNSRSRGQAPSSFVALSGAHINKEHFYVPGGTSGKEPACQCRRHKRCGFNPWVRKIPWRRNGNPLRYSCLENPMDRGAWCYHP